MPTLTEAVAGASGAAEDEYRRDGNLAPVVVLTFGEHDLIVHLAHGHAGDHARAVVGMAKTVLPIEQVAFCSEAWAKLATKSDPPDPRRGYVRALHDAGDPDVRTALVTVVVDREPPDWIIRTAFDEDGTFVVREESGCGDDIERTGFLGYAVAEPLWKQATMIDPVPENELPDAVAALAVALGPQAIVGIALTGPA